MTPNEMQLRVFLPGLPEPAAWTAALTVACTRFDITSMARVTAFLGQVAHESGEFRRLVENLNYSADRLVQVWPNRFPTLASALPYAHQPEKIANRVYSNRLGNGDEGSGDGWRFRGRGLIQLTGRSNYQLAGLALHMHLAETPDEVAKPLTAALTAAHYWQSRGLNQLADLDTVEAFDRISHHINGGVLGIAQRRQLWARAKAALA